MSDSTTRVLRVQTLDAARRFPLEVEGGGSGLARDADHACPQCGAGPMAPVVVTTWDASDRSLWHRYPLALEAWHCAACGAATWPAFLGAEDAQELVNLATDHARGGRLDEAEFCLRRLVNSWPGFTTGRVKLAGLLELRLGQAQAAGAEPARVQRLEHALERQLLAALHGDTPAPTGVLLALGRLYADSGRPDEAAHFLEATLAAPDLIDAMRLAAERLLANALYQQAVALASPHLQLADLPPSERDPAPDLRAALPRLERVVRTADGHWPTWWLLGKVRQALGEAEGAREALDRAVALAPDRVELVRELALAHMALGEAGPAYDLCVRAVELEPADHGLKANLALALVLDGRVPLAAEVVRRLRQLVPSDPVIANLAAFIDEIEAGTRSRPARWPEVDAD